MTSKHLFFTRALAIAAALLACLGARAHAQSFDVQQLRLTPNQQDNYFGQHSARILRGGGWQAGLVLDYANDPLVVVDEDGERVASLVGDQLSADVLFAVGLGDRLELGLDVPLVLLQEGEAAPDDSASGADAGFGIADVHVMAKLSLWQHDTRESPGGTAFALVLDAQLPTGDEQAFQGEGLRLEPRAVLDVVVPRSLRLSAQVGYLVRPESELLDVEVDDTLTFGLGLDLPLDAAQHWHLIGEGDVKVSVLADEVDAQEIPVEVVLGGRHHTAGGVMIELGGGFGLNHGFGTPDYRLLAGVTYGPPDDPDPDRDGLLGDADQCPSDPEDKDRFQDEDGCPDPDNDADGVLDGGDRCPNAPEDKDGFEDEDGCADADNDADGVLDAGDACPNDPEDKDGFEDENGCSEPDNDKDGLPDGEDTCPNEPEDFDGFADDDGCPESGSGLVKLTCEKIDISERVYFDTGKDSIQERSFGLLDQVASVLKSASYVKKVRVEGHTDDRGRDEFNLDLSSRRAASVVRFLVERGVQTERLTSEGYGETKPIASNKNASGRAENRRVEFMITEQDAACEK